MKNLNKYLAISYLLKTGYKAESITATGAAAFFRAARKDGAATVRKTETPRAIFHENAGTESAIETRFDFYHCGVKIAVIKAYRAFNSDSKKDAAILAASM